MCKIQILFLDREFEHDIYELIKAFYPGAEFHISYSEEEEICGTVFRVEKIGNDYEIRYKNEEHKGVVHAEVIEGQTRDALISCLRGKDSSDSSAGSSARGESSGQECDQNCKESEQMPAAKRSQEEMELRKQNKDSIKYALYRILEKMTGRTLPWGNLTGIRPAKLAMGMIESGMTNPEIAREMREKYLVSPQKAALAITIANREREILKNIDYENGYSLYVGIPFCPSICLYCSFSSYPLKLWKAKVDDYLDALCKEIRAVAEMMKGRKLDTVYIGGGTPTTLEPEQFTCLLGTLDDAFGLDGLEEFTVEAGRPDSITEQKLMAMRKFPVSRISVNPQTMNQKTLDIIGRRHTVEQTKEAFHMARECGYDNINMDLIVGLPGEDYSMVEKTLEEVRKLSPDSLTVHSLAVKRAARLNMFKDRYQEMTFENNQQIMDLTMKTAYEMGMGPYYLYRQKNMKGNFENVGYAAVDKAGIYNILIMEEKQPIIALGAGGSSKLVFDHGKRIERVENVKDVSNYISRIDEMIERKRAGIRTWL